MFIGRRRRGKLRVDSFNGAGEDPARTIADLNGDGKKELILYGNLDSDARTRSLPAPVATWPQVYRLQNGAWVEASRDFPRFYDTQILPQLEKDLSKAHEAVTTRHGRPVRTPDLRNAPPEAQSLRLLLVDGPLRPRLWRETRFCAS